jgi:FecR protein
VASSRKAGALTILTRVTFLSVLLFGLCAGSPASIAQTPSNDQGIGGTGHKSGDGNGIGGTGEPATRSPGIGGTGEPAARSPGIGGTGIIGTISDVENDAQIVSASGSTTAAVGLAVHMKDQLRTGTNGRLQVTFQDHTVLTLGEDANIVIDRYVFDPDRGMGAAVLQATQGAFRFAAGQLKDMRNKMITVSTPVAEIGVRGTEFWGGPIDDQYGVLLIEGEVTVRNQGGTIRLSNPGEGTEIRSRFESPRPPTKWAPDRVTRALGKTVTRHDQNLHKQDHGPGHNPEHDQNLHKQDHGPGHNPEHGPDHRSDLRGSHPPGVEGAHPPGGRAIGQGRNQMRRGWRNLWRRHP